MFFYEGFICPVCKEKFKETDDIVACPDCGAPHHRNCWLEEGHCAYADDHGTPRQWKRPHEEDKAQNKQAPLQIDSKAVHINTCSRCGKANPQFAEFCSKCGFGLKPPDWSSFNSQMGENYNKQPPPYGRPFPGGHGEYTPFHMPIIDPFGGVAHDENIDGVSAEDFVAHVGNNSAYYLPRFLKLSRTGSRASWNWAAFLFTPYWLLYRKNYLAGGIVLFLSLLQTVINNLVLVYYIQPSLDMSTDSAMLDSMLTMIQSGQHSIYFTIITLIFFVNLLVRIIFGMSGNWLYKRVSVTRIRRIREKTGVDRAINASDSSEIVSDYRRELSAQGGVSLILVAVASGILWFGQMLFQALMIYF